MFMDFAEEYGIEGIEGIELQSDESNKSVPMRKRASYVYHHISNEIREELVRRIIFEKEKMTKVSRELKVNYSSVKSVINTYKSQGRVTKIPHRLRKCTDKKKKTPTANSDQQMEIASNDQSCQMDTQYSYSYSTLDQPLNCEESQVKQQYLSNEPVYIYESYERGIYDNNQFVQEDMSYDRFYQFNSGPEQNVQRWEDPLLSQMQNFAAKQLQTITELNSFLGGNIF